MSTDDVKTTSETDDTLDDTTLDQVSGGIQKEELREHDENLRREALRK